MNLHVSGKIFEAHVDVGKLAITVGYLDRYHDGAIVSHFHDHPFGVGHCE
jgi:hypothetical protein